MYGRVKVVEGGHPLNLQILARVDTVQVGLHSSSCLINLLMWSRPSELADA